MWGGVPSRPVTSIDGSVLTATQLESVSLLKATSIPPTSSPHHSPQWLRLEWQKLVDESPGREIAMLAGGEKSTNDQTSLPDINIQASGV